MKRRKDEGRRGPPLPPPPPPPLFEASVSGKGPSASFSQSVSHRTRAWRTVTVVTAAAVGLVPTPLNEGKHHKSVGSLVGWLVGAPIQQKNEPNHLFSQETFTASLGYMVYS